MTHVGLLLLTLIVMSLWGYRLTADHYNLKKQITQLEIGKENE